MCKYICEQHKEKNLTASLFFLFTAIPTPEEVCSLTTGVPQCDETSTTCTVLEGSFAATCECKEGYFRISDTMCAGSLLRLMIINPVAKSLIMYCKQ